MIRLLHSFISTRIAFTDPLHQGQSQFSLAVLTLGGCKHQRTNKLKSNKLIN